MPKIIFYAEATTTTTLMRSRKKAITQVTVMLYNSLLGNKAVKYGIRIIIGRLPGIHQ